LVTKAGRTGRDHIPPSTNDIGRATLFPIKCLLHKEYYINLFVAEENSRRINFGGSAPRDCFFFAGTRLHTCYEYV